LFLESYHSKRHTGQGNIFFGRTRYKIILDWASNRHRNINNTLYPVTTGCQASIGTIVCRVQIDGTGCYWEAAADYLVSPKKTFSWPRNNLQKAQFRFGQQPVKT
jgi:hypothetical protein